MPAYLIVNYTVDDPELYGEYQSEAGTALEIGAGTELVVFDTATRVLEGDGAGAQTVVLEFDSVQKARDVYESEAYQAVVGKRLAATSRHFAVLVEGIS